MRTFALLMIVFLVPAAPLHAVPIADMDLQWFRDNPIEPHWGPDPFVPKVNITKGRGGQKEARVPFVLSAVLLGGETPAAILNGSVVHKGETVMGHRVVKITNRSIFLRGASGTTEVPLKPLFSLQDGKP